MTRIGLIGIGLVGLPIAQNLIEAGYSVSGYRRGEAKDFTELGGIRLASPRSVMEHSDIVISCIPDDAALSEVVSGPEGLTQGDCGGKIVVELSTLSEAAKRGEAAKLEVRGGIMLDGAVSGLPPMVRAKTATYFISGDPAAVEQVTPVLNVLTRNLHPVGDFGAATRTKLCANMLVAANLAVIAETLSFGARQGLDLEKLVAALSEGAGTSVQFKARAGKMATGDWHQALGPTAMLLKDVKLIQAAADASACPVPMLASARAIYEAAVAAGYGESDVASIYGAVAQNANLQVPNSEGTHHPNRG